MEQSRRPAAAHLPGYTGSFACCESPAGSVDLTVISLHAVQHCHTIRIWRVILTHIYLFEASNAKDNAILTLTLTLTLKIMHSHVKCISMSKRPTIFEICSQATAPAMLHCLSGYTQSLAQLPSVAHQPALAHRLQDNHI